MACGAGDVDFSDRRRNAHPSSVGCALQSWCGCWSESAVNRNLVSGGKDPSFGLASDSHSDLNFRQPH
jgi:hypothetical protein